MTVATAVSFDADLMRRYHPGGSRYTSYPTALQFHEGSAHTSNPHSDDPFDVLAGLDRGLYRASRYSAVARREDERQRSNIHGTCDGGWCGCGFTRYGFPCGGNHSSAGGSWRGGPIRDPWTRALEAAAISQQFDKSE